MFVLNMRRNFNLLFKKVSERLEISIGAKDQIEIRHKLKFKSLLSCKHLEKFHHKPNWSQKNMSSIFPNVNKFCGFWAITFSQNMILQQIDFLRVDIITLEIS